MLKILLLGCFAYIVFWFWALFSTIIPWLGITVSNIGDLTLWQIIAIILFFVPGLFPLLLYAFIGIGMLVLIIIE